MKRTILIAVGTTLILGPLSILIILEIFGLGFVGGTGSLSAWVVTFAYMLGWAFLFSSPSILLGIFLLRFAHRLKPFASLTGVFFKLAAGLWALCFAPLGLISVGSLSAGTTTAEIAICIGLVLFWLVPPGILFRSR